MSSNQKVTIMFDTETLGLGAKSVIWQASFIAVDGDDPETILRECEEYLPLQPQLDIGRKIDANTLLFWMKQPNESRAKFDLCSGADMEELTALVLSINKKMGQALEGVHKDDVEIWCRGPQFDITLWESLLADLGQEPAYRYDRIFDLRTVMREAGIDKKDVERSPGLTQHHALSDCRYQLECLHEARRRMRSRV